ncbi:GAF and ANTAR domain-containing protein [Kitasatospora sp. NPDC049258]|uniref:GAF and ANTAR domain-containing protein n=1 Tax=Kitasatospora sp. NPDC049258 TaxID=3155394 RepID=UPI003445DF71
MISSPMARALLLLKSGGRTPDLAGSCEAAARALGVDALAVALLTGTGRSETLWCSDDTAHRFDDLQFTLGEGPGHDAARTGRSVLVPDLTRLRVDRWPALATEVPALPVRAVFCLPLGIGAINVGVLTAVRRTPGPLTGPQTDDALVLASALTARYLGGPDTWLAASDTEFSPALLRAVVHQATGMLSVQLSVPLPQALLRLRAHAYSTGRPIGDISRDVVDRRLHLDDNDRGDPPGGGGKD